MAFPPFDIRIVRNVSRPTLTVFLPDPAIATGTGVIVCPGGAFHFLAIDHEGYAVAEWLTARGIAAFVLKYRVQPTAPDDTVFAQELAARMSGDPAVRRESMRAIMQQIGAMGAADAEQAIKLVRTHAADWGVDPARIGLMGFSAGARITTTLALHYTAETRPSFAAPIYGGLWQEIQPQADAPPLFIALTSDDAMAVEGALPLYSAWRTAGHPVEMHIYAAGGHGFGLRKQGLPVDSWIERFGEWLTAQA
jgi:acetyl esterase/lipase